MKRMSVVCFKYEVPGYRTQFTSAMVNQLFLGLARHFRDCTFELVCITDDPKGLISDVFVREIMPTFRGLQNPTRSSRPNCYPRLPLFDPSNPYGLQDYWISIDLDALIVGDMTPFLTHRHDFVVYKVRGNYCGSMFGGRIGAHPELFTEFDPQTTPAMTNAAGFRGSDQAWFSYKLGPDMPTWEAKDGVLGWQDDLGWPLRMRHNVIRMRRPTHRVRREIPVPRSAYRRKPGALIPPAGRNPAVLPEHARIVHFYGEPKAWSPEAQQLSPWILEHYR